MGIGWRFCISYGIIIRKGSRRGAGIVRLSLWQWHFLGLLMGAVGIAITQRQAFLIEFLGRKRL